MDGWIDDDVGTTQCMDGTCNDIPLELFPLSSFLSLSFTVIIIIHHRYPLRGSDTVGRLLVFFCLLCFFILDLVFHLLHPALFDVFPPPKRWTSRVFRGINTSCFYIAIGRRKSPKFFFHVGGFNWLARVLFFVVAFCRSGGLASPSRPKGGSFPF